MNPSPRNPSARLHCLVSAIALGGAFAGWNLWFVSGGWQRQQHWGEGILWAVSAVVGLWAAVDAIRFACGAARVGLTAIGLALACFHIASFYLLLMFIRMLAEGGPRP